MNSSEILTAQSPAITRPSAGSLKVLLSGSGKALMMIFCAKALTFAIVGLGFVIFPLNTPVYDSTLGVYHTPDEYSLATRFTTWDSGIYLLLAEDGHRESGNPRNGFAPLLPALIRAANTFTGDSIVSGLLIANLASVASTYAFFRFVRRRWGQDTALRSLALLLSFPTAFFMTMIYTESLFLLLCLLMFLFVSQGRFREAAVVSFLLPLSRFIGILIAAPLALGILLHDRRQNVDIKQGVLAWLKRHSALLYALAPIVAVGLYMLYMQAVLGDPLEHEHVQDLYEGSWSLSNVLQPWLLVDNLVEPNLVPHDTTRSIIDRFFFLAFLASAPLVYRKVDKPLFVFYISMGLTPLLGSFIGYMRYVSVAFPLYIAYGEFLATRPLLKVAAVTMMVVLQAALLIFHTSSIWVA